MTLIAVPLLTLWADILRQDWMPVLNLGSVAFGLMTLFLEPNPDDPLNKGNVLSRPCGLTLCTEAAKLMIEKPKDFEKNVKMSLRVRTSLHVALGASNSANL